MILPSRSRRRTDIARIFGAGLLLLAGRLLISRRRAGLGPGGRSTDAIRRCCARRCSAPLRARTLLLAAGCARTGLPHTHACVRTLTTLHIHASAHAAHPSSARSHPHPPPRALRGVTSHRTALFLPPRRPYTPAAQASPQRRSLDPPPPPWMWGWREPSRQGKRQAPAPGAGGSEAPADHDRAVESPIVITKPPRGALLALVAPHPAQPRPCPCARAGAGRRPADAGGGSRAQSRCDASTPRAAGYSCAEAPLYIHTHTHPSSPSIQSRVRPHRAGRLHSRAPGELCSSSALSLRFAYLPTALYMAPAPPYRSHRALGIARSPGAGAVGRAGAVTGRGAQRQWMVLAAGLWAYQIGRGATPPGGWHGVRAGRPHARRGCARISSPHAQSLALRGRLIRARGRPGSRASAYENSGAVTGRGPRAKTAQQARDPRRAIPAYRSLARPARPVRRAPPISCAAGFPGRTVARGVRLRPRTPDADARVQLRREHA
ncbi:hypothetical protein HYPSUDRAFT_211511 [Hypholoma sublateritium FD-334 SS-4]|uniref:Uncharacterized protein n=1 Tax=Hypholoma sublateritium (strain FD-334 SS-4) TaxID=945553 RepID=A0A0D2MXQ6_HYPSF|nr:hypothetical protein HYPSUDRAFT_211511 [Hypholoma sublateritium FD-334 SS-4]